MMGKNDDAANSREDSFLAGLIPQAAEHLAEQHAGDFDAEAGRARFLIWLTEQTKEPAADLAKVRTSGGYARPRRTGRATGRAGTRHPWGAALIAAGLAGTALLLAFLFHLGVAAVAVAILATVPTGYLAWVALPGALGLPEPGPAAKPVAGRPVRQWDPRLLGVHAAISVPGTADEVPPEYVPRDVDAAEHGMRAKVAAATSRGGFVLLVGGSSVGKTRTAVEAVKALLPDWWLVHPDGPAGAAAVAAAPPRRTVVWLDELQRYLDGKHGLAGGTVRALLDTPGPVVIIGTLWPDRYAAYTALPAPGGPDQHAREREVLGLAAVIRISPEFSPAEQDRARAAAARDRRLREALGAAGYGLTQTLAAAPQLIARWEDARAADPYAWAVLTAALDASRIGARAPLSGEFLRAAAPGYCTPRQQAEAPATWFEQALAYATEKLHGAVAALTPAGAGMGQVVGYTAADYLIQHVSRERRYTRVPANTWEAILSHIRDPADTARLADSAERRLLYRYAIPLYRHTADAGDVSAAKRLADLLAERGDLDEAIQVLRALLDAGEQDASVTAPLANLLAERGDLDALRARADTDLDWVAALRLARLLAERGDLDGLRARADTGDGFAASWLATALAERGDWDGLRARADTGDEGAALRLGSVLAERGDLDGLRARADTGDGFAAVWLAYLLAERGDWDGAEQILRARADTGDGFAALRLADLLEERGDLDEAEQILRALLDAGEQDTSVTVPLADLLKKRGDLDALRARADAGDLNAASRLASLLAERGDLDGLRARAERGDWGAAELLADLLAEHGDLDGLRARADAGDGSAAKRLAYLLAERGDWDGLRGLADAGSWGIATPLADLLTRQGRGEEADLLRRFGLNPDGSIALG